MPDNLIAAAMTRHVLPWAQRRARTAQSGIEVADLQSAAYLALRQAQRSYTGPDDLEPFWNHARGYVRKAFQRERHRMAISPQLEQLEEHLLADTTDHTPAHRLAELLEQRLPDPLDRDLILAYYIQETPIAILAKQHDLTLTETQSRLTTSLAKLSERSI